MGRELELMIRLTALKDVELWLNEQYVLIAEELLAIREANSELLSNCCSAPMIGEETNRTMHDDDIIEGRCSSCKEMASFSSQGES